MCTNKIPVKYRKMQDHVWFVKYRADCCKFFFPFFWQYYVNALSVNEHSGVRSRGQLTLLSFCRRYSGACATALPKLITILSDKNVEAAGHEQRICGACVLLQTRYFQGRILRDWRMIEHFLITLCSSYHNDKETVLDALDGLFATFLSYWYQISLDCPGYLAWKGGRESWDKAQVPFER